MNNEFKCIRNYEFEHKNVQKRVHVLKNLKKAFEGKGILKFLTERSSTDSVYSCIGYRLISLLN